MKVIVAGSRYLSPGVPFDDYPFVAKCIASSGFDITEIVCGMAIGVDTLGERWAISSNVPVIKMPADWNTYGKSAGAIRNRKMGEVADGAIIIWDGKSPGTRNMIDVMTKLKKPYHLTLNPLPEHHELSGLKGFMK